MRCWLLLLLLVTACSVVGAVEFYVSPSGSDRNAGTRRAPFATLERARMAVRTAKRDGGVTVFLRQGRYALAQTLVFGPEDGGTAAVPVCYRVYPGETATISGGQVIAGWKRLDGDIWTAPVAVEGWTPRLLYVGGEPRRRSRWPHEGFYNGISSTDGKTLTFPADRFPEQTSGGELITLVEWSSSHQPLDRATIAEDLVTFPDQVLQFVQQPWAAHIRKNIAKFPFYFENLSEVPLAPGEWRYDSQAGKILYHALPTERPDRTEILAGRLERLVEVVGTTEHPVEYLTFRGLTFAHSGWQLPSGGFAPAQAGMDLSAPGKWLHDHGMTVAFRAEYARQCLVEDCRFLHLGGAGISLERGCHENLLQGNEVADVGGNGMQVGEVNDLPPADRVCNNTISNNYIHACGAMAFGCVGIWNGITDGTVMAHNEICDLPYTGISVGWDWSHRDRDARRNRVEYNHIHHVMQLLADGGGVYTLGKQPESTLTGNLIHDVFHKSGIAPANGIFLDNGSEGWTLDGNIVYHAADGAIRYNTSDTNAAFQHAGANYCDILPDAPTFPVQLAARAGLEAAYRGLLGRGKTRNP